MPAQELSRRRFIKLGLESAASLALLTACGQRTPAPTPTEIPKPTPNPALDRIVQTLYPQELLYTPSPIPAAVLALLKPDVTPTPPLPPVRPRPVETPKPKEGRLWSIETQEPKVKKAEDTLFSSVFAYIWTGKKLYIASKDDSIYQHDLNNPGLVPWKWNSRGTLVGQDAKNIYILHKEAPRLYAIDTEKEEEVWRITLDTGGIDINNFVNWPVSANNHFVVVPNSFPNFGRPPKEVTVYDKTGKPLNFKGTELLKITDNTVVVAGKGGASGRSVIDGKTITWNVGGVLKSAIGPDYFVAVSNPGDSQTKKRLLSLHDLITGSEIWNKEIPGEIVTVIGASENLMAVHTKEIMSGPENLMLIKKSNGEIVDKVNYKTGYETDNYLFFSFGKWTFLSHPKQGTKAYFEDKLKWENDDILGATRCVGEHNGNVILSRGGILNQGSVQTRGIVWNVDQTGKKFAFPEALFDVMSCPPVIYGNSLLVADVVGGRKTTLVALDLLTGQKKIIDANPPDKIRVIQPTGFQNIVLAPIDWGKLLAYRVTS